MGQHKRNQTAIAAREGKIPPKKPPLSAYEIRRIMRLRFEMLAHQYVTEKLLKGEQNYDGKNSDDNGKSQLNLRGTEDSSGQI